MVEYYFLSMITDFRLKVFETVARRLNFTRAAEELFITQPAVTRHIKELERLLDARLFKREGRGIALTAEGVRLLAHSRRILKEYETLAEEISFGRNSPVSGELSLGASSTMSQYVLPPLLALFNRHYPEIRIWLKSGNTEEIEQAVQDESVQLGIVEGTATRADLHYQPFMEDEIILAGGMQAAVPSEGLSLPQLSHVPLIMREPGSGTRRVVEEALKKTRDLRFRPPCSDDAGQYGKHQNVSGAFSGVLFSLLPCCPGRIQTRKFEENTSPPPGNSPHLPLRLRTWRPQQNQ